MTPRVRLLVVDDHTLFRRGLVALLSTDPRFEVVAEAGDAGEAQRHAMALQPDVILLDNHMPGVNGVDALAGLLEAAPATRVLMLTVSEDERDLATALRAGARGYLLKTVDQAFLCDAILRTLRGESSISPELTGKLVNAFQSLEPARGAETPAPVETRDSLSPQGAARSSRTSRKRCQQQGDRRATWTLPKTTVKIHVQHILRKLGLSSRVQAAVYLAGRSG
jgi:two-component system nitrate/nitrite response regulator NarL